MAGMLFRDTPNGGGGGRSGLRYILMLILCATLILEVCSLPVPDTEAAAGNNDLASGEEADHKSGLDESFVVGSDTLVGVQPEAEENKPKQTEETEVVYRTQTQGFTMPKFVFTTGPTTLPPVPKITTFAPSPQQTTPRPDEIEWHVEIHGEMTPPSNEKTSHAVKEEIFTTANLPEAIVEVESTPAPTTTTTTTTVSTTTTEAADIIVDVDVGVEEAESTTTTSTTTSTTTTTPSTTTTSSTTSEADDGAILVKVEPEGDKTTTTTTEKAPTTEAEDLEPMAELLPTKSEKESTVQTTESSTTSSTTSTTTTTAPAVIIVDGEDDGTAETTMAAKQEASSTTTTESVVVIVESDEQSTTTTSTTSSTSTTEEVTTKESIIFQEIVDMGDQKTTSDVKYTTPTTTENAFTTRQPTEESTSTTTTPVPPLVRATEKDDNNATEKLQKIVVPLNEVQTTVIVDMEDEVNGTLIGESTQGGLTRGERIGIAIACIIVFWIILGPIVCLICKMRDKKRDKKEQEERNAREKASNNLVEEMVKAELQKTPNGDHKKALYKDDAPFEDGETEPITIGNSDSMPYIDADANSRDTAL